MVLTCFFKLQCPKILCIKYLNGEFMQGVACQFSDLGHKIDQGQEEIAAARLVENINIMCWGLHWPWSPPGYQLPHTESITGWSSS